MYTPEVVSEMTRPELREAARSMGLNDKGGNEALRKRILEESEARDGTCEGPQNSKTPEEGP